MALFVACFELRQLDSLILSCRTTPITQQTPTVSNESFDVDCSTPNLAPMDAILVTPILAELVGGGFTLTPAGHYVPRWPRVKKVYFSERDWREGLSVWELDDLGKAASVKGPEEERERREDTLAVVDRLHAAEGTVIPSERVGERAKREMVPLRESAGYGEMKFGLDIEGILKLGQEIRQQRENCGQENVPVKRKESNEHERPALLTTKRICLANKPSQQPIQSPPKKPLTTSILPSSSADEENISQLLTSASILTTTKPHYSEIYRSIHTSSFFDLDPLDDNGNNHPDRENFELPLQSTPPSSKENVVLVDRYQPGSVKKALRMARRASSFGGRWHVYHWEVVKCMNGGDSRVNWKNQLLWTYVDGEAH
jgi:hypothetical protein